MDELDDDEVLSQFGSRIRPAEPDSPFRRKLREQDADGLSAFRGRCSPDQAAGFVTRHRRAAFPDDEGVRYTTVGKLRDAGFHVKATPSKWIPSHISVMMVGETWTEDIEQRFDACFDEDVEWKEET